MILRSLRSALARLISLRRLWLLYYLFGLVFAAAVALPARSIISSYAGNSLTAGRLSGAIDMTFIIELLHYRAHAISPLFLLLLLLGFGFWLLMLFFSGGALKLMVSDHPYRAREFWDACGRYFGRFFRLLLWSAPLLALLLMLTYLVNPVRNLIWGRDPGANIVLWSSYVKMGGRYIALLLWALVFDYARIMAMQNNEKKTRRLLRSVLKFVREHFFTLITLALLLAAIGLVGLVLYNLIANQLHAPSVGIIVLLFIWQQIYMLFRAGLRLLSLGSQARLAQQIIRSE